MVKKYVTTLKNGAKEQKAFILGRTITLYDGEVVSEGILTKTFPSLFEEIIDIKVEEPKVKEKEIIEPEELLIDESSNVEVVSETKDKLSDVEVVEVEKVEAEKVETEPKPKKSKSKNNNI